MTDRDRITQEFERQRPRLRAVAYRMLGSLSEADDAVQESWLRLNRSGADEVTNLAGWLWRGPTPSRRPSWRTRSAWRCWWCWTS